LGLIFRAEECGGVRGKQRKFEGDSIERALNLTPRFNEKFNKEKAAKFFGALKNPVPPERVKGGKKVGLAKKMLNL